MKVTQQAANGQITAQNFGFPKTPHVSIVHFLDANGTNRRQPDTEK
jgi:hypothetical protein